MHPRSWGRSGSARAGLQPFLQSQEVCGLEGAGGRARFLILGRSRRCAVLTLIGTSPGGREAAALTAPSQLHPGQSLSVLEEMPRPNLDKMLSAAWRAASGQLTSPPHSSPFFLSSAGHDSPFFCSFLPPVGRESWP